MENLQNVVKKPEKPKNGETRFGKGACGATFGGKGISYFRYGLGGGKGTEECIWEGKRQKEEAVGTRKFSPNRKEGINENSETQNNPLIERKKKLRRTVSSSEPLRLKEKEKKGKEVLAHKREEIKSGGEIARQTKRLKAV